MKRLYNLDYLRGLAAFSIMLYHYLSTGPYTFPAESFIGRLGIYGVSIFYVLSGMTLYYVYFEKMKPSVSDVLSFTKKRILRIFPLLWLVTLISIILLRAKFDIYGLILNLTGLFGFFKWDTYYSSGVWSIGNELVFYAFFPFFILLVKKSRYLIIPTGIILFSLYIYFSFFLLSNTLSLEQQWRNYVNPLNQVFPFFGGFITGLLFHNIKINKSINNIILLIAIILFTTYPVKGDPINLVTGYNRIIFTFLCFTICFCFYKLSVQLPHFLHKPLTILGESSYSVYLLHPIINTLISILIYKTGTLLTPFPFPLRLFLSIALTLLLSYYVYEYFEKFFMKMGRNKQNLITSKVYNSNG